MTPLWLPLLLACTGAKSDTPSTDDSGAPPPMDLDGDGWVPPEDCDDAVATTHPDAEELCNGVDDDCDGLTDEDLSPPRWYADGDGDGWGDPATYQDVCVAPEGYVVGGGDCDDGDAYVHPDATDLPGDGIDADCDGDYTCETLTVYEGDLLVYGDDAAAIAAEFCAGFNAISGSLVFSDPAASDLSALSCLCSVGDGDYGSLLVYGPGVRSLAGLDRLVYLEGPVEIAECPLLDSLSGLEGLRVMDAGLILEELPALTDLEAVRRMKHLGGLGLANVGVTSLDGLRGLGSDSGMAVGLFSVSHLTSLEGLPPRAAWDDFNVQSTPIEDLSALAGATSVDDLILTDVEVPDLHELASLERIEGSLRLAAYSLVDLRGLESLGYIGGDFEVFGGDGFVSMDGLGGVQEVGALKVTGEALGSIEALFGLEHAEQVVVGPCEALPSLAGLESLQQVDDYLQVGLTNVTDLEPLSSLTTVGGNLYIAANASLTSVSGLSSLTSVGGDLWVIENPSLPTADAEALVEAIGRENIGGEVYIYGNGP